MTNGAVIARCSQPEVGWLGWRSPEDEALLHAIGAACAMDSAASSLKNQLLKELSKTNLLGNGHVDGICNGDVIGNGDDDSVRDNNVTCESGVAEQPKVLIVDARAYSAAVVNRAKGGGCECEGELTFSVYIFYLLSLLTDLFYYLLVDSLID